MVFEWKPGSRYKVDANIAGTVCEQLEAEGNLSAKSLLDVSRPEDAPLHSVFEWDDAIAAEAYRETQAGGIIRNLVIRVDENPETEPVRGFFKISTTETSYTNVNTILVKPNLRQQLLKKALAEMTAFQKKYSSLCELASVFSAMQDAQASII